MRVGEKLFVNYIIEKNRAVTQDSEGEGYGSLISWRAGSLRNCGADSAGEVCAPIRNAYMQYKPLL